MKIGIVSDSHGRVDRLALALRQLIAAGAEAIVHCGDLTDTDSLRLLGEAGPPAWAVAGNMDRHDLRVLYKAADDVGVTFAVDFVAVPIGDGEHLAATHGHLEDLLEELIRGGQFRYVCCGHSHRRRDDRCGEVRVLNPGALFHPRGGEGCSCMLLDSNDDHVSVITIGQ